jgi:hypothetical protein
MFWKQDYRHVMEPAVRNSLAASRPENAAFPGRWLVYRDLLSAYLGIDPLGYEHEVRELLTYLDREIPPEPNTARYLLLGSLRHFHSVTGEFEAAEAAVARAQELLDRDPTPFRAEFSMTLHCAGLCWIAHRRQDWEKLRECAVLGEELARKTRREGNVCRFLMWQAVLARRDGDERRATRLHTTANTRMAQLNRRPELEYANALALFYELGGDLEKVLKVRDLELAAITNSGCHRNEYSVHLERAVLLAKMGRLQAEDLDAARKAALRLRKPEKALAEIDKLTASVHEGR